MLSFYSFPNCCTAQIATGISPLPDELWKQDVAKQLDGFQDFSIITLITTRTQKGAHPFLKEMGFEKVFVGRKSHNTDEQRHQETGDLTLWAGEPAILRAKSKEWRKNNPFDPYESYKKSTFPVKNLVIRINRDNVLTMVNQLYKPADYTKAMKDYESRKNGLFSFMQGYIPSSQNRESFGLDTSLMARQGLRNISNDELIAFQERLVKDGHIKGFKSG